MKEWITHRYPNYKYALATTLYSLVFIVIVCFTLGSFFEDYETLANQTIIDSSRFAANAPLISTENFLLYPILVQIQEWFPAIPVYSLVKMSFVLLFLVAMSYIISLLQLSLWVKYFLVIIVPFLFLENVVLINNVRISLLLAFTAYAILAFSHAKMSKGGISLFLLLIVAAILNRIEMSIIASGLGVMFVLLYNRDRWTFAFLGLALPIIAFLGLQIIIGAYDQHSMQEFSKYEGAIYDRQDFKLKKDINTDVLTKQELEGFAAAFFLTDRPTLKDFNYDEIIGHSKLFDYVFNNPDFLDIYKRKVTTLLKISHIRFGPLLYISLILSVVVIGRAQKRWKFVLGVMVVLILPLVLHAIGTVPARFISPYLTMFAFLLIIYLLIQEKNRPYASSGLVAVLLLVVIGNFIFSISPKLESKLMLEEKALTVQEFMRDDINSGNQVFLNYLFYEYVPARLFISPLKNVDMIYADAGSMGDIRFFKERNEHYFGEEYESLAHRYTVMMKSPVALYSTPMMMKFQNDYLGQIHNLKYDYTGTSLGDLGESIALRRYVLFPE